MSAPVPHLCVATPCFAGNITHAYHTSMMTLAAELSHRGVRFSAIYTAGDSLITRARNRLLGQFLENPEFTHLMFIDADIGFSTDQVLRLLNSGHGVVGGIYPLKNVFWDRIAPDGLPPDIREARSLEYVVGAGDSPEEDAQGFLKVEYVGTGFLLIARDVIERLCEAFPETRYYTDDSADKDFFQRGGTPSPRYALFETKIDTATGRYLSEDYAFCDLCHEIGEPIWADLQSRLEHIGFSTYSGDVAVKLGRRG
ncbi:hypothetical protein [Azospirillum sp. sgz301742]